MNITDIIEIAKESDMPALYGCKFRHDLENDDCPCDENGKCTQSELVGFNIPHIENLDKITKFAELLEAKFKGDCNLEKWKLVPIEPTDEMIADVDEDVGGHCYSCTKWKASDEDCRKIYKAMLQAAPNPPKDTK